MNTGFTTEGFPSFGAWTTHCGSVQKMRIFRHSWLLMIHAGCSGKNNFGNGFLPAAFQGTDFNATNPPKNLSRPEELTGTDDAKTRDIIQRLNAHHLEQYPGDVILLVG